MGGGAPCVGCNWHKDSPAPRGRELHAGRTSSLLCALAASAACGDSYGKSVRPIMCGGFYGQWYALYELYLASGEPRAAGANCMQAQFAFMRTCRIRGGLNPLSCRVPPVRRARRILWEAVRFAWAVTGMRIAPRRRREEGAGSACRADQSAFMRRHMAATASMGSDMPCMGCNLHEGNPAPQARKSMRVQPAHMRGVRGSYGKRCVL